ncbi:polyphosphate--glucose phosphotransferase [Pseudoclavibacter terrae]|uniref:ROK family protein n=1 Tax=Pseudoclavibacter terrae TaxID=1530195 RepID=A0A7J5AZP6_9MICO|nr:ROK family protein [Pseudoclavibacter terrae]KAB1636090.1 ROK family protein [Pseudoclavibacter terrae]
MTSLALGVDVGGTGIKAGLVDLETGLDVGEACVTPTPEGAYPEGIASAVARLVEQLRPADGRETPVGVCVPAVVRAGRTFSAANISRDWIGLDARALFADFLGQHVSVMNDADAAGYAEARYGAAKNAPGLVLMTTLGTGIGVAMINDGVLVPNSELGHIQIDGIDWETRASVSAKEREGLTWQEWAGNLQKYYSTLESLINPDLFIVGGGISAASEQFLPLLSIRTPIVAATLHNQAGVTGAAALAAAHRPQQVLI